MKSTDQANPALQIVLLDPFVLKTGWWMNKGGEWDASRAQINQMHDAGSRM